ncbi:MAG: DegT/DnrJ/EryC1/StrS family aminotransferase [Bacteroidia bacterium]|nr:DegT/DnrJ/EryC1/StrS family aminotransferase [Bacteroidia bacterium]
MHIPFFRFLPDPDALAGIEECLQSGWLTTGPKVKQFEQDFVNALGNPELHAVALNSCTAALHLALEAIGLKRGDRVLVPTMTFAATAEVVRYFDAIPILCDVDPDTLCITPTTIRAAISQDPSSSPLPTGRGAGGEGRGAGVRAVSPQSSPSTTADGRAISRGLPLSPAKLGRRSSKMPRTHSRPGGEGA